MANDADLYPPCDDPQCPCAEAGDSKWAEGYDLIANPYPGPIDEGYHDG